MSSRLKQVLNNRRPWLGAALVFAALSIFSLLMPLATGLHARAEDTLRPTLPEVSAKEAGEQSLAGKAGIIDLRIPAERKANPVPGGAITPPGTLDRPQWNKADTLLQSLTGTPVHIILPVGTSRDPAFFQLRKYNLDLSLVGEGF